MRNIIAGVAVLLTLGGAAYALANTLAEPTPQPVSAAVALQPAVEITAGSCCRVIVSGCSKSAKVCVSGECSLDNQKRCRTAFEKAYSCPSTSVSSYIGTCNGETCDIDLR